MRISAAIIDEEYLMEDSVHDQCPSEKDKKTKGHSYDSYLASAGISQNHFQDMLKKFKLLTMSDPSSGFCNKANSLMAESQQFMALSAKEMENLQDCPVPLDEPTWLHPYFEKMKEEIKREIIDELLFTEKMCNAVPKVLKETETAEINELIHEGIFCDNCDQVIRGIRYKCGNCSDYDLCQKCENLPNIHHVGHIFLKMRYPVSHQLYKAKNTSTEVGHASTEKIPNLPHQLLQDVLEMSKRHKNLIRTCKVTQAYLKSKRNSSRMKEKNYFPAGNHVIIGQHHKLKIFQAEYVRDETIPDGTVVAPSATFVKSWRVMNSGNRSWTKDTKLRYVWGSKDLRPTQFEVDVPSLKPGEEGIICVTLDAPSQPGMYQGHWKFRHKNSSFGHFLWCNITVAPKSVEDKQQTIEVNVSFDAVDLPRVEVVSEKENDNKKKEVASIAQVLTAVKEEHDRGNMIPRKLVVTSHTATPTNTPFDLTPPKSPEPQKEPAKDLHDTISNTEGSKLNSESDCDDEGSILSLSSSESDTEFVVIPMPRCFNMSESFAAAQSQACSQYSQLTWTVSKEGKEVDKDKIFEDIEKFQHKEFPSSRLCFSETVSQETGVPEVSENVVEAVVELVENAPEYKLNTLHLPCFPMGGSSSEISIVESDESSPSIETFPVSMETILTTTSHSVESREASVDVRSPPDIRSQSKTLSAGDECQDERPTVEEQITFPKFPVEGIEADVLIAQPDDRTVQVIPEGLLTGALSAAATVYNTAKAVISHMQHPRNEQETCLSREFEASNKQPEAGVPHPRPLDPMLQLIEMGFCNRQVNEQYLHKHKGDVALVVSDLVNLNDNEWYASRHNRHLHTNFE